MKSFDIFDTLLGRWYKYPDSIFYQLEQEFGISNFVWGRKHAESLAEKKDLYSIYEKLSSVLNIDPVIAQKICKSELNTEKKQTFPIVENVNKLTKDSILISDTYYNESQLIDLLDHHNIKTYKQIFCSYNGKSSGDIWKKIKPDFHLGDNENSDYRIARANGINATLYTNGNYTENERWLENHGYPKIASLCRMLRLVNPIESSINYKIWEEQSQANVAILILLSNYLNTLSDKYDRFLLTQRDCCYLYPVFNILYPNLDIKPLYVSRFLYTHPTYNFNTYIRDIYTNDSLIVDFQGTGSTCLNYFSSLGITPNYFTVVDSNLTNKSNILSIVKRNQGYSDRIEKFNYTNVGKYIDVIKLSKNTWHGVTDNFSENEFISTLSLFNSYLSNYLNLGYTVEKHFNKQVFIDFLNYIEKNCIICNYVNHEVI